MTVDVTVVVPVYNTRPYLSECLDSLLAQSLGAGRMQVVAVDDGSTDGSGELLDDYAATHPALFHVVHQDNSGGPARPCNVGLGLATGRFVFFLGSDDHLAPDALQRMVTAADEWGSDIVLPPVTGVGGRSPNTKIYGEDQPDVPFPHSMLPFTISNTKLFRRALLTEHQITYAKDLPVGSDQPFTIEAMLAAGRISVLGGDTAYFAVKREDDGNITFRSDWRERLSSIETVMDHVAGLLPAGPDRDAILLRHFEVELSRLVRHDLRDAPGGEGKEIVAALATVAARYLTDGIESRMRVRSKLVWWHVRAADIDALLELATYLADEGDPELDVRDGRPHLAYPRYDEPGGPPLHAYEAVVDNVRFRAGAQVTDIAWVGTELRVAVRTNLRPTDDLTAALVALPVRDDSQRLAAVTLRQQPRSGGGTDLQLTVDGAAVHAAGPASRRWGLWLFLGDGEVSVPVRTELSATSEIDRSSGPVRFIARPGRGLQRLLITYQ